MKFIDNPNDVPKATKSIFLFDKVGKLLMSQREKSYAKKVTGSRSDTYYIITYEGVPHDPWGMHSHREAYIQSKFKKVSKKTFDFYMLFLQTKNSLYMTRAQRSFIND